MHSVLHTFGFSMHVTSFMHIHIWACMVSASQQVKKMKGFPVLHEVVGFVIIVCFCYFYFYFLHTCEYCISQSTFTVLHTPFGERVLRLYTPPTPSSLQSMLVKIPVYRMHCVTFNCCFLFPFFCLRQVIGRNLGCNCEKYRYRLFQVHNLKAVVYMPHSRWQKS